MDTEIGVSADLTRLSALPCRVIWQSFQALSWYRIWAADMTGRRPASGNHPAVKEQE
jgi:hypothetical protein